MEKFITSFKENAGAIATALIAFLFVLYYLAIVIPQHRNTADKQNLAKLDEFNSHLNEVLKDYANAVDIEELRTAIMLNAQSLLRSKEIVNAPKAITELLNGLNGDSATIIKDWANAIIVRDIRIVKITETARDIILDSKINIVFDKNVFDKKSGSVLELKHELLDKISTVSVVKSISKRDLKEKLKNGAFFCDWLICSLDTIAKRSKTNLINNNIDIQECDSLHNSPTKLGVVTYKFSNKRFYKHSYTIDNAEFDILLIGAVNAEVFEARAKSVQAFSVVNSILIILLLFLSIPLIKPLISSSKETLNQLDLINTTLSVGIFIIVLVSYVLVNYLGSNRVEKIDSKLMSLDTCVNLHFNTELLFYKNSLTTIQRKTTTLSGVAIVDLDTTRNKKYKYLQNFFFMNSDGDMVKDLYANSNRSFRKNFRERDYFKNLVDKPEGFTTLSAAFSKYSNRFVSVFATKGKQGFIEGVAYTPVFSNLVTQKLELDYGYMICNQDGVVLMHSDSSKKLNENIYTTTDRPVELYKLRNGAGRQFFTCEYNNKQHRFYGRRLSYGTNDSSSTAVYLFTFKKLDFENNLKVFSVVNGFLLSLGYTFGIVALAVLYSIFFYLGHVSLLSRYHIYWLFPDDSRTAEFTILKRFNIALIVVFSFVFVTGIFDLLYLTLVGGINLVFVNFVLLSQRVFLITSNDKSRNQYLYSLVCLVVFNFITAYILYYCWNQFYYGLGVSLVFQFLYLAVLRKKVKKPFDNFERRAKNKERLNRYKEEYPGFLASVISYHYFLVPIIIVFILFSGEIIKLNKLNAFAGNASSHISRINKNSEFVTTNKFTNTLLLLSPPSSAVLYKAPTRFKPPEIRSEGFAFFIAGQTSIWNIMLLIIIVVTIWLIIWSLSKFYTGRFFFADLSEAYKTGYFSAKNQFENLKIIIPPFDASDLKNVEKYERISTDEDKSLKHSTINTIPDTVVSPQLKMELILIDNLRIYSAQYRAEWDKLTYLEKMVMSDFATDHFVNYKNKALLVELMHKGLIIADPLTGRLRVMNYGFRNFVVSYAEVDPTFLKEKEADPKKALFAKWRLPILIIAFTILMLVTYLYKQSFDQVLLFGGTALSAIGLLTRLMDSYKKA